jgi:hypothetical protein
VSCAIAASKAARSVSTISTEKPIDPPSASRNGAGRRVAARSWRKLPRACVSGMSSHSRTVSRSRDIRCPGAAARSASNAIDFRAPRATSWASGARNSNRPRRLTRQRSILLTAKPASHKVNVSSRPGPI